MQRWDEFKMLKAELSVEGADLAHQATAGAARREDPRDRYSCRARDDRALHCARPAQRVRPRSAIAGDAARRDRREPRDAEAAFAGQTLETPWDKFHVAYFASEALWTYLTSPFLYTYPGFESEKIEPWQENGKEWRWLKVTFPEYVASHTKTQITHFGPDGLMRRHDYTVDPWREQRRQLRRRLSRVPRDQDADEAARLRIRREPSKSTRAAARFARFRQADLQLRRHGLSPRANAIMQHRDV
jgi:hypothetical protein